MRAYVVGGEIVAAVLRSSQTDFRSNFSLGGNVECVQPTDEQREIVQRIYNQLQADYIGVDFLPDGEKWVVNEIEDSAGARMLYQCTDIDIADVFVSYLVGSLKA
jgi:glutathione synthase/RimK-type ligase-like ATP-grasp enzyme